MFLSPVRRLHLRPTGGPRDVSAIAQDFWFGEVVTIAEQVCVGAAWVSEGHPGAIVHTSRFMSIGIKVMDGGRRIRHTAGTRIDGRCANWTYFNGPRCHRCVSDGNQGTNGTRARCKRMECLIPVAIALSDLIFGFAMADPVTGTLKSVGTSLRDKIPKSRAIRP
jgi:hypothetical protein